MSIIIFFIVVVLLLVGVYFRVHLLQQVPQSTRSCYVVVDEGAQERTTEHLDPSLQTLLYGESVVEQKEAT